MKNICEGKSVSLSAIQERILNPSKGCQHTQAKVLEILSSLALKVAQKHADSVCLALGIECLEFYHSINEKDLLMAKIAVNRSWENYMEIGVKLIKEDFRLLEQKKVLSAYFHYKAIDANHNPIMIPRVIPETKEECKRFREAEIRRSFRFSSKKLKKRISPHIFYVSR